MPPPQGSGRYNYLTAVTEIDKELIEILDVEKILDEICPIDTHISEEILPTAEEAETLADRLVLIADDSAVARNQVKRALVPLGVQTELRNNGREMLDYLKELAQDCPNDITDKVGMLISDIEMPEMDGYTLTAEIKSNPKLAPLHVILHTSLSGVFNHSMVEKVGADDFIAKFNPDELGAAVRKWLETPSS